ncbi:hypothetical protein GWI33_009221 [Rhynchophorus ferrugineus]|uniref:Uncharacterized protein n=1 Tax=Rhynchophorus ferrugineus TaxID=354439 RepID=A0A834IFP1_RHYFE|nr:hypothetical protein GWI33_009221 [Rhynchophorus ferrugineus]
MVTRAANRELRELAGEGDTYNARSPEANFELRERPVRQSKRVKAVDEDGQHNWFSVVVLVFNNTAHKR